MAKPKLEDGELRTALLELKDWSVKEHKLHREYKFPDFAHAFGFMTTCAFAIEKKNHHPEWFNSYNSVIVDLTTHDSGGITRNDVELAQAMDMIAAKLA
jgi:4a-hydroxytetrahydrobiopterin dehydratase